MRECSSCLSCWNVKIKKEKERKETNQKHWKSSPMEDRTCLLFPHGSSVGAPHSCFWGLGFPVNTFYIKEAETCHKKGSYPAGRYAGRDVGFRSLLIGESRLRAGLAHPCFTLRLFQNEVLSRQIQKEIWRIQDVMEGLRKNNPSRGTDTAKHRGRHLQHPCTPCQPTLKDPWVTLELTWSPGLQALTL